MGWALDEAYGYCERLARTHYENFPVGSWLLPRATRKHLWAIYAFARTADDWADEPGRGSAERRLSRIADWERRVAAAHAGDLATATSGSGPAGPVFTALADTMAARRLPLEPFRDLLSAFAQDVTKRRYATWAELLDYCRRSANPVGRLVLLVHGYDDAELFALSDAICTALQLTNHWQDLALDLAERDRLYVPQADLAAYGVCESELARGQVTDGYRRLMADLAGRTRALFDAGRPLPERVGRDLRFELRLVWHGGRAVLERTAAAGFDVWRARPTLRARDLPRLLLRAGLGR
ncbi:MAG TPA: squalene synthase HpnC [Thermodesulfobacteriota bacterium]|nr:squalene synthase HpnC [Thermodesulfobacteriota bacterium]